MNGCELDHIIWYELMTNGNTAQNVEDKLDFHHRQRVGVDRFFLEEPVNITEKVASRWKQKERATCLN